jgi:hypothetical protein
MRKQMAKAKRQAVKTIPNPRTAQQPIAQSGADLMRAIGNLIPAASPIIGGDAETQRMAKGKGKGRGR